MAADASRSPYHILSQLVGLLLHVLQRTACLLMEESTYRSRQYTCSAGHYCCIGLSSRVGMKYRERDTSGQD